MKTRLLSVLCVLMMSLGIQAHDLEPLHVDGRYLKNPKGDIVTLHGFLCWYPASIDFPDVFDETERDFLRFKITTDSMLNSGWKMDYARVGFSNQPPSDFEGFVRNNLFENCLRYIDYLNSKGIYALLICDAMCDSDGNFTKYREIGEPLWQRLMNYWNYVSSHPRIKNNPGVMFELANEPGTFQGSDGSLTDFRTLKAYYQPMVDIIRNNGCQQVIWVPGSGCQSEYRGYASYPIEGDNIGYAVHAYDWCGGRDYETIRKYWDATVKPVSNMAPIIITETGWEGRYALNLNGDWTKPEDPPLTSDFGINSKRVWDELGNVSFNWLNPNVEIANTGLPTETPSVINDPEGPLVPGKEWYKEYAKTKYTSPASLSATNVELIEAPTCVLPSKVIPLTLMATFSDGRKWSVAGDAIWTSSDESVLVVNHGNIFVKSEGTATIYGQYTDGTGKVFNTQFTVQSQLFPLTQEGVENFWESTFDEATHTFSGAGEMGWDYTASNPLDGASPRYNIDLQDYQYIVVRRNEPAASNRNALVLFSRIGADLQDTSVDLDKMEVVIDLHQLPNIDLTRIEKVAFGVYNSSLSVKEIFLSNDGVNPVRYVQPTSLKASDAAMTYGDEVPQLPYTVSGFANAGTPKLTTTATKTSPVGTYDITAEAGSGADEGIHYLKGRMTVMKAPLMVGVEDVTINDGDDIPTTFTLTYDGWRNNDNSNALTSKPIASTTATSHSIPDIYPITVNGGESQNYALNYLYGTLTILEDKHPLSDRIYTMTLDNFHEWDGCTETSEVLNNDYRGEIHVGETLEAGSLVYGDANVIYIHYANLTKYDQLIIEGTPGMELRVLINRLEVGNGGGDANGGSWTELNPVIGDDEKAIVDLSDLEFVHLNAIKTGWGSPEGIIKGLYVVRSKVEQPIVLGDLNDDGSVSITDVVLIIDVIAGSITDTKKVKAADVNKDGSVTITDCVAAIDLIAAQTKSVRTNRSSAVPISTDNISASLHDNLLTVNLDNENHYTAFQMVVTMPEGMTLDKAVIDKLRGTGHQLTVRNLGNGQYLLAGFSMGNSELAGNSGCLLTITTNGQDNGEIVISDIEFATAEAEAYHLAPITISSTATGIYQIENREWKQDDVIFDLQGRRVNHPSRGLYIVNGSKLIVK